MLSSCTRIVEDPRENVTVVSTHRYMLLVLRLIECLSLPLCLMYVPRARGNDIKTSYKSLQTEEHTRITFTSSRSLVPLPQPRRHSRTSPDQAEPSPSRPAPSVSPVSRTSLCTRISKVKRSVSNSAPCRQIRTTLTCRHPDALRNLRVVAIYRALTSPGGAVGLRLGLRDPLVAPEVDALAPARDGNAARAARVRVPPRRDYRLGVQQDGAEPWDPDVRRCWGWASR